MKFTYLTPAIILSTSIDNTPCTILHHTDECGTDAQMEICIGESNFSNNNVKYQSLSFREKGFWLGKKRGFKRKITFDTQLMYFNYRISGNILIYLTSQDKAYNYNNWNIQEKPFLCLDDSIGRVRTTFSTDYETSLSSQLVRKRKTDTDTLYTYKISYNENCSHCTLVNELVVNNKFQFKKITLHSSGGWVLLNACVPSSDGDIAYE